MKGKRRISGLLLVLLLCFAPFASAQYWKETPEEGIACREKRPGCHILQMAMAGTFSQLDVRDSISVRVFAAVLPQLSALTDADFEHFVSQFDVPMETIQRAYYIALGNCLRADIAMDAVRTPEEAAVYRVLLLFLNPDGEDNAEAQKRAIRRELDDEVLSTMADSTGLPRAFIEYLINTDHWQTFAPVA